MTDLEILARDKYDGDASKVTDEDRTRLAAGEPLAYVIGWIPFLGLRIGLSSKPLIPRPETEWWTEKIIKHLRERFGDSASATPDAPSVPFRFLDLCAGSGAIGLAVHSALPNARVSFGELMPAHAEQIRKNIGLNSLDAARADIRASDLFSAFDVEDTERWDIIATNPPYIPNARATELDASVTEHEPHEALFSGEDGLDLIRRILQDAPSRLTPGGELWMECDIANIEAAQSLALEAGAAETAILTDQYGRPRVLVAYFGY